MSEFTYHTMPVSSEPVDPPEPKTTKINFGEHMFIFTEGEFFSGLLVKLDTMTLLEGGIGDFLSRSGEALNFEFLEATFETGVESARQSFVEDDDVQDSTAFSGLGEGAFESDNPALDEILVRFEPLPYTLFPEIL